MSVDALGRLEESHVNILEQVITFLIILAHHKKNRTLQVRFYRSGETISRYFNKVLSSVIRVQSLLFAKVVPVPDDQMKMINQDTEQELKREDSEQHPKREGRETEWAETENELAAARKQATSSRWNKNHSSIVLRKEYG
ncbi:hypothetical protein Ahy_A06g030636 isoform B [Arachis hypogaea]|uniref:DUF8040 domain-containing protein n=1 Tax=Arachis hypogaea TaxID=3818 RepID=A0A445CX11_ARAHY|nr:hypothetical protein Ahy_A06g030636 isoform B [Arachis hypogaea]